MKDFIAITGAVCLAYMCAWLEYSHRRNQSICRNYH